MAKSHAEEGPDVSFLTETLEAPAMSSGHLAFSGVFETLCFGLK